MADKGKKIAEWIYEDGAVRIKVPVSMMDGGRYPPTRIFAGEENAESRRYGIKTYFRVKMDEPDVFEEDVDIDQLKKRVMRLVADRATVEWRTMLLVTVTRGRRKLQDHPTGTRRKKPDPNDVNDDGKVDVDIGWELVQIAERKNGKKVERLHRTFHQSRDPSRFDSTLPSGHVIDWHKPRDGWPDTGQKEDDSRLRYRDHRERTEHVSMIPDTPENRAALERIADAIEALGAKLMELLGEKVIERTLSDVTARGLSGLGGQKLLQ